MSVLSGSWAIFFDSTQSKRNKSTAEGALNSNNKHATTNLGAYNQSDELWRTLVKLNSKCMKLAASNKKFQLRIVKASLSEADQDIDPQSRRYVLRYTPSTDQAHTQHLFLLLISAMAQDDLSFGAAIEGCTFISKPSRSEILLFVNENPYSPETTSLAEKLAAVKHNINQMKSALNNTSLSSHNLYQPSSADVALNPSIDFDVSEIRMDYFESHADSGINQQQHEQLRNAKQSGNNANDSTAQNEGEGSNVNTPNSSEVPVSEAEMARVSGIQERQRKSQTWHSGATHNSFNNSDYITECSHSSSSRTPASLPEDYPAHVPVFLGDPISPHFAQPRASQPAPFMLDASYSANYAVEANMPIADELSANELDQLSRVAKRNQQAMSWPRQPPFQPLQPNINNAVPNNPPYNVNIAQSISYMQLQHQLQQAQTLLNAQAQSTQAALYQDQAQFNQAVWHQLQLNAYLAASAAGNANKSNSISQSHYSHKGQPSLTRSQTAATAKQPKKNNKNKAPLPHSNNIPAQSSSTANNAVHSPGAALVSPSSATSAASAPTEMLSPVTPLPSAIPDYVLPSSANIPPAAAPANVRDAASMVQSPATKSKEKKRNKPTIETAPQLSFTATTSSLPVVSEYSRTCTDLSDHSSTRTPATPITPSSLLQSLNGLTDAEQRKAMLQLSKVSSKRFQALSWPRSNTLARSVSAVDSPYSNDLTPNSASSNSSGVVLGLGLKSRLRKPAESHTAPTRNTTNLYNPIITSTPPIAAYNNDHPIQPQIPSSHADISSTHTIATAHHGSDSIQPLLVVFLGFLCAIVLFALGSRYVVET
jgi:hypothetical protein